MTYLCSVLRVESRTDEQFALKFSNIRGTQCYF